MRRRGACLILVCSLVGCGTSDVGGGWSGTWRTTLFSGDMQLTVEQADTELSGTFDLDGTGCVGSGTIDGDIDRRNVVATLSNSVGGSITIDADVNVAETRMTGKFDVDGGWCTGVDGRIDLSRD